MPLSKILEYESLTQEQKLLVDRIAAAGTPTTLTFCGQPLLDLMPAQLNADSFEPLSEDEEAELIRIVDEADAARQRGELSTYDDVRKEWGLDELSGNP
jgi:hypothetical protein